MPKGTGPVLSARVIAITPGHKFRAHMLGLTIRDERGRIGIIYVPGRLNTCRIGDAVAVRGRGIGLVAQPGQCRMPE